jgi:hypothetical protein
MTNSLARELDWPLVSIQPNDKIMRWLMDVSKEQMLRDSSFLHPSQRSAVEVMWNIKNIPGCWRQLLDMFERDAELSKDLDQLYLNRDAKQALRDRGFTI